MTTPRHKGLLGMVGMTGMWIVVRGAELCKFTKNQGTVLLTYVSSTSTRCLKGSCEQVFEVDLTSPIA